MTCKKCGKENRPEAKYCRFCGEELASASSQKGLIAKDDIVGLLDEMDKKGSTGWHQDRHGQPYPR